MIEPSQNTDSSIFLNALREAYPNPVWNPNSTLHITAHSRASDLRRLGWNIKAVQDKEYKNAVRPRKKRYGYLLILEAENVA